MTPAAFDYRRPRSLAEAIGFLRNEAKVFAGGQSLGPMLNLRLARPGVLVEIRHVPDLKAVSADARVVSIGATVTHAEIEDALVEDFTQGFLPAVARGIAYRAVRNRGTIGGSLAHADPAADWVSALAAVGATVVLTGRGGARRVAADAFVLGAFTTTLAPDEIVTAIEVPRLSAKSRWGYHKVCRKTGEFAKAIGVAVQDPTHDLCRILVGSTEGRPILLARSAEELRAHGAERAGEAVRDEIDTVLPHLAAAHRQQLAVCVRRSLGEMDGARR